MTLHAGCHAGSLAKRLRPSCARMHKAEPYATDLSESAKFACPARLTAGGSDTFPLLELDAAGFDGARGGAIEVGQGFGKIGMGADFAIARGDQVGLALQHQEDARRAGLKLALLARVL